MDWLAGTTTQARFASMVGISEARVSQLVSDGLLVKGQSVGEWLLVYCGHLREQAAGRVGVNGEGGSDLTAERAALTRVQREREELLLAELRGELLRVDVLRAVLSRRFIEVRDAFMALPARLAPTLAAKSSINEVHALLDSRIRDVLTDVAYRSDPTGVMPEQLPSDDGAQRRADQQLGAAHESPASPAARGRASDEAI